MHYGQFHSDVNTEQITLQQLYPGCQHVLETTICSEELPDYQQQSDGTYVSAHAPDECAACLQEKEIGQIPLCKQEFAPEEIPGDVSLEELVTFL